MAALSIERARRYTVGRTILLTQALTLGGAITLGTLTFLAGAFNRMQGILLRFSGIAEQALYLQDFFDFLAIVPRITSQPGALPFPNPVQTGFTFEKVSFRYPDAEQWAIRHLSFQLHPVFRKRAIVGTGFAPRAYRFERALRRAVCPSGARLPLVVRGRGQGKFIRKSEGRCPQSKHIKIRRQRAACFAIN